jgi:hypothetical protein
MRKYIIILFILVSCKSPKKPGDNISKDDFKEFLLAQHIKLANYNKIIIIPGVGCGGCISDAQATYLKNYKDVATLYIFTAITDLKMVNNMLPSDAHQFKNIIIDKTNYLVDHGFKSIYPSEVIINDVNFIIEKF